MSEQSTTTNGTPHATNNQRDAQGRFLPGNTEGMGNPFARQVAALRATILERLTPEKLAGVIDKLIASALEGDVSAAKVLLAYGVGKPAPTPNPDRLDIQEWDIHKKTASMGKEMEELVLAPSPEFPLELVRATRPLVADTLRHTTRTIWDELKAKDAAAAAQPATNGKTESATGAVELTQEMLDDLKKWLAEHDARAPSTHGV